MGVRIIADSACDITNEEGGIGEGGFLEIVPITVTIDEIEYLDGVNLSHADFYGKLVETDDMPVTSQINPLAFQEAFRKAVDEGYDVVAITISSKLSGTYDNALLAAREFDGRVHVVDSLNAAIGEQVLVRRALELASEGLGAADIAKTLDREKHDIRLIALLDTLEYLKRGGRISGTTATIGEMLSIKPVIAVEDGEVVVLGKARGSRKGNNLLMEQVEKTSGVDFTRPYVLGYSGFDDSMLDKYIDDSRSLWEGHVDDLPRSMIGATIGTHVGPGAIGLAFFQKN